LARIDRLTDKENPAPSGARIWPAASERNVMNSKALLASVMITTLIAGCGKSIPQENADSVQKPVATDVVLLTPIGLVSTASHVVQLRETDPNGCTFVGSLTPDFTIAVEYKKCGSIVSPASFVLPLSRTHTYADVDGKLRSGYGAGDRFVVRVRSDKP
jgi:hypothetical protein